MRNMKLVKNYMEQCTVRYLKSELYCNGTDILNVAVESHRKLAFLTVQITG